MTIVVLFPRVIITIIIIRSVFARFAPGPRAVIIFRTDSVGFRVVFFALADRYFYSFSGLCSPRRPSTYAVRSTKRSLHRDVCSKRFDNIVFARDEELRENVSILQKERTLSSKRNTKTKPDWPALENWNSSSRNVLCSSSVWRRGHAVRTVEFVDESDFARERTFRKNGEPFNNRLLLDGYESNDVVQTNAFGEKTGEQLVSYANVRRWFFTNRSTRRFRR